jgi:hypothetical protein
VTTGQITLPAPRTWSVDDLVTVPRLRADVADSVALLLQRPYFVGQCTTGYTVPGGGGVVPLDAELTDTWGGHPEDAGPAWAGLQAAYWCPLPGWYLCDFRAPWTYASTTPNSFLAGWTGNINGGTTYGPNYGAVTVNGLGQGTTSRAVDLIPMTFAGPPNGSGDFIQPFASAGNSGTIPLNTSPANLPTACIRWACSLTGTEPLPVPPLAAVPSPITSAWLNGNVRDTVRFLTYPPVAKAYFTPGSATLANSSLSSPQVLTLNTTAVDNYGGITLGASAKYTAPVAGRYFLAGQFNLGASSVTTWYACGVMVNGSAVYWGDAVRFAGSPLAAGAGITKRLRLSAGDYVQLVAAQASGGGIAYNTTQAAMTMLIAAWEGI